ncbi:MAG: hypothetical protein Q9168_006279 [Polycauliona sp. 1 TL-2023]
MAPSNEIIGNTVNNFLLFNDPEINQFLLSGRFQLVEFEAVEDMDETECICCSLETLHETPPDGLAPEQPIRLPCNHVSGIACLVRWTLELLDRGQDATCPKCRGVYWYLNGGAEPAEAASRLRLRVPEIDDESDEDEDEDEADHESDEDEAPVPVEIPATHTVGEIAIGAPPRVRGQRTYISSDTPNIAPDGVDDSRNARRRRRYIEPEVIDEEHGLEYAMHNPRNRRTRDDMDPYLHRERNDALARVGEETQEDLFGDDDIDWSNEDLADGDPPTSAGLPREPGLLADDAVILDLDDDELADSPPSSPPAGLLHELDAHQPETITDNPTISPEQAAEDPEDSSPHPAPFLPQESVIERRNHSPAPEQLSEAELDAKHQWIQTAERLWDNFLTHLTINTFFASTRDTARAQNIEIILSFDTVAAFYRVYNKGHWDIWWDEHKWRMGETLDPLIAHLDRPNEDLSSREWVEEGFSDERARMAHQGVMADARERMQWHWESVREDVMRPLPGWMTVRNRFEDAMDVEGDGAMDFEEGAL